MAGSDAEPVACRMQRATAPRPYIVCATQRTGSTLLCEALRSTGTAGHPDEFLEPSNIRDQARHGTTASPAGYLHALRSQRSSPNGAFGLKVMFPDLVAFLAAAGCSTGYSAMADQVEAFWPGVRYIWVTRRDKVRQAVSYWRAIQSEEWHRRDPLQAPGPGTYSYERIHALRAYILDCEDGWRAFFRAAGTLPLVVEYEALADAYEETVRAVLDHLRLPAAPIGPPTLQKLADDVSDAWVERFLLDEQARRDGPAEQEGIRMPASGG